MKRSKSIKKSTKKLQSKQQEEPESTFFLKMTVFLILGSQWLYLESGLDWRLPIPLGLLVGLVFAHHDHFKIDRKIEYVVLLFAAFISFWLPLGITIQL